MRKNCTQLIGKVWPFTPAQVATTDNGLRTTQTQHINTVNALVTNFAYLPPAFIARAPMITVAVGSAGAASSARFSAPNHFGAASSARPNFFLHCLDINKLREFMKANHEQLLSSISKDFWVQLTVRLCDKQ
ncbi:hypothetical protein GPALN_011750 [Globodera pallida]|nr:hypothetical protein GPALN_011750 [Globodera pallida]